MPLKYIVCKNKQNTWNEKKKKSRLLHLLCFTFSEYASISNSCCYIFIHGHKRDTNWTSLQELSMTNRMCGHKHIEQDLATAGSAKRAVQILEREK